MAFVLIEVTYVLNHPLYTEGKPVYQPVVEHGTKSSTGNIKHFSSWRGATNFAETEGYKHYIVFETTGIEILNVSI